jgi:hypothetical protein
LYAQNVIEIPDGNIQEMDYDKVDWDESLDSDNDREMEDKWFDEDD